MAEGRDGRPWQVLVLAAGRGPGDPIARAFGVSHKCLVPIAGQPMLRHVVATLAGHPRIERIAVSSDDAQLCSRAGTEQAEAVKAKGSAAASVLHALHSGTVAPPVLVTTADHPLLSHAMLDHFLAGSERAGADVTAALAEAETVLSAYPDAARTFLSFAGRRFSGCNLFGLRSIHAERAVRFWEHIESRRKSPAALVRAFGPVPLLLYLTGRLDLDRAFALASSRFGLRAAPVLMPFAEAAIDVDRPEHKDLVERILTRDRLKPTPPPCAVHAEGRPGSPPRTTDAR